MFVCICVFVVRACNWLIWFSRYTSQAWVNEPYRRIVSIADCSIRSYAALASAATEDKASATGADMAPAPTSIGYQTKVCTADFQIQVCKLQLNSEVICQNNDWK